jgi:hypothetical protein
MKKVILSVVALVSASVAATVPGGLYNSAGEKIMDATLLKTSVRSKEYGGTKDAIDAYRDGVGVFVSHSNPAQAVDYSPMNKLVYKYGEKAKESNVQIHDQVLLGSNNENKTASDTKLATRLDTETVVTLIGEDPVIGGDFGLLPPSF